MRQSIKCLRSNRKRKKVLVLLSDLNKNNSRLEMNFLARPFVLKILSYSGPRKKQQKNKTKQKQTNNLGFDEDII